MDRNASSNTASSRSSSEKKNMSHHTSFLPTNINKRSQHILDSESTDAQSATEDECAPFFVDLQSLPEGQLDHLRGVGLLPPLPLVSGDNDDDDDSMGMLGVREVQGKAARLLGVEYGRGGPRPPTQHDDGSSSPNSNSNDDPPFDPYAIRLLRSTHASYLLKALSIPLSRGFVSLDASHPWMVYWCLHSLDLLGYFDIAVDNDNGGLGSGGDALKDVEVFQKAHLLQRIVSTLEHCWTDVPLEFHADEVATDVKLKQLLAQQTKTSTNNGPPPPKAGEKVSITGGGFGGGPHQMPHCAPTYAAVLSLTIVASVGLEQASDHPYHDAGKLAMELLTKRKFQLYAFFLTLPEREAGDCADEKDEERIAFRMQHDGEVDVRASYCILAPCYLLGLLNNSDNNSDDPRANSNNPLLSPSISRHIASCQTFEGGFGAEPFNEAHGGYSFCALAALRILHSVSMIDVNALSSWLARRQMGFEGGFSGRTNKLVDGCYSFWQGGAVAVLDGWYNDEDGDSREGSESQTTKNELSYDEVMLQRYILLCAQDVNGGLRDKPSKPKDFYHSCYNLSGLSVAQHALEPWPPSSTDNRTSSGDAKEENFNRLFGDVNVNVIGRTDPVINIRVERVKFMLSQQ